MADHELDLAKHFDTFDAAACALLQSVIGQTLLDDLTHLSLATAIATARERVAELRLKRPATAPQGQQRRFRR